MAIELKRVFGFIPGLKKAPSLPDRSSDSSGLTAVLKRHEVPDKDLEEIIDKVVNTAEDIIVPTKDGSFVVRPGTRAVIPLNHCCAPLSNSLRDNLVEATMPS